VKRSRNGRPLVLQALRGGQLLVHHLRRAFQRHDLRGGDSELFDPLRDGRLAHTEPPGRVSLTVACLNEAVKFVRADLDLGHLSVL